ncbi:heat shock protein DNAj [Niveomyces insectorum RCEF 264]|uniref:Heat shock protein DNAj n=1 Tax=Niveomyces insectorum RCEF 264 TaxID=1081102 RepID=A0A167SS78_9HYPO|nr:heat shock protein DNAj [Niveomyces insectorum RCEF 264]
MVVETALYEQLGVASDASPDTIKRAYRQAALLWHPDRNPDDPSAAEMFKVCLQAYEILSDPAKRTLYDAYGLDGVMRSQATPSASSTAPATSNNNNNSSSSFSFSNSSSSSSTSSPRGFHFQTSWSFTTGGGGVGRYTTETRSWNSRDGHQSSSHSGSFGGDGNGDINIGHPANDFDNLNGFGFGGFGGFNHFPRLFRDWDQGFFFPPFGSRGGIGPDFFSTGFDDEMMGTRRMQQQQFLGQQQQFQGQQQQQQRQQQTSWFW